RGQCRPQGAQLVRARLLHLPDHVHLIDAHATDDHVELDRGGGAAQLRVHPRQVIVQGAARARERQVVHVDLPDLWDEDGSLARDLELVGLLYAARQRQDQNVTRTQAIHRIDGTGELWQELGRRAAEHMYAELVVPGRQGLG